jgi:hypothetical protein
MQLSKDDLIRHIQMKLSSAGIPLETLVPEGRRMQHWTVNMLQAHWTHLCSLTPKQMQEMAAVYPKG